MSLLHLMFHSKKPHRDTEDSKWPLKTQNRACCCLDEKPLKIVFSSGSTVEQISKIHIFFKKLQLASFHTVSCILVAHVLL